MRRNNRNEAGDSMVKIAVIGVGARGLEYMSFVKYFHKKEAEITGVCDYNPTRLAEAAKRFKLPADKCFANENDFFGAGKQADAIFICTQDKSHYNHALKAIDAGYQNILLEKPVSNQLAECDDLAAKAKANGVNLVVCHVLRYSNYYKKIKEILRSGELGEIVTINHSESIAYFHFAHSFVRGNWHNEAASNPSLLAKCCHDIDLLQWFMDAECKSVSSLGSLTYFKKENAPEGAAKRCLDGCKAKAACPYDAESLYIKDPFYKATFIKYMGRELTDKLKSAKAEKYEALKTGDYGKCVYFCDNDVADHQTVTMDFGGGKIAVHTMSAFTDKMFRKTHITCTKGEIIGQDNESKITVNIFGRGGKKVRTKIIRFSGHVEGDFRLITSFIKLINGALKNKEDVTFIDATIPSHRIIMAAEESRHHGGVPVDAGSFAQLG